MNKDLITFQYNKRVSPGIIETFLKLNLHSFSERACRSHQQCNNRIDCYWLTPNDEAGSDCECPPWKSQRCNCNKEGSYMCEWDGEREGRNVCYSSFSGRKICFTKIQFGWNAQKLTYLYNCHYILFTNLPWPEDSKVTFWSSSQAATCSPVYQTRWRLHTVPLIAERQAGKL